MIATSSGGSLARAARLPVAALLVVHLFGTTAGAFKLAQKRTAERELDFPALYSRSSFSAFSDKDGEVGAWNYSNGSAAPTRSARLAPEQLAALQRARDARPRPEPGEAVKMFRAKEAMSAEQALGAPLPAVINDDSLRGRKALQTVHEVALWLVLPGMVIVAFVLLVGSWMSSQRYTALIPDSAWQVFLAALCGVFIRGLIHAGVISKPGYAWASATFLNLFLLPIIIFQSGWALHHSNFMSQLEYIGIFAVLGTVISFFFVGFIGYWLGQRGLFIVSGLRENLAFAALISATDPVATLCTFSKLGLDRSQPLLYTLLFGESVLNDAVAIVLFHAINSNWDDLSVGSSVRYVCVLLFGSAAFGIVISSLLVLLLRLARLPGNTVPETLYILASAWLVFAAAESCKLSGIIADLCAGCIFRLYGSKHLERKGFQLTDDVLMATAQLMDAMVFILCGVSTALISSLSGAKFAVFGFLLCLVGRALSTSSCALISNAIKSCMKEPDSHFITLKHQCVMWHAGLRGGIALLLSMDIDTSWCHDKGTIINATFIIICSTLVLFGGTTEPMLQLLGLQDYGKADEEEANSLMNEVTQDGPAMTKKGIFTTIHRAFKCMLVGDAGYGKERRQQKRAFMKTMKKTGSAGEAAGRGDDGFHSCCEDSSPPQGKSVREAPRTSP